MSLTRYEKETIVNYNQESDEADIYTRDEVVMRRLDKLCEKYPDYYRCVGSTSVDKEYRCPKRLVGFKNPVIMTEEQKEEAKKRGRALYEKYLKKKQDSATQSEEEIEEFIDDEEIDETEE